MVPNEARAAEHIKTLNAKLDAYEKLLSNQAFLAGNVTTTFPVRRVQPIEWQPYRKLPLLTSSTCLTVPWSRIWTPRASRAGLMSPSEYLFIDPIEYLVSYLSYFLFSLDGSRLWNIGLRGSQSRMVFSKCYMYKSGCDGGWLILNVTCNTHWNVVCTITGWDRLTSSFSVSIKPGWIRFEDSSTYKLIYKRAYIEFCADTVGLWIGRWWACGAPAKIKEVEIIHYSEEHFSTFGESLEGVHYLFQYI